MPASKDEQLIEGIARTQTDEEGARHRTDPEVAGVRLSAATATTDANSSPPEPEPPDLRAVREDLHEGRARIREHREAVRDWDIILRKVAAAGRKLRAASRFLWSESSSSGDDVESTRRPVEKDESAEIINPLHVRPRTSSVDGELLPDPRDYMEMQAATGSEESTNVQAAAHGSEKNVNASPLPSTPSSNAEDLAHPHVSSTNKKTIKRQQSPEEPSPESEGHSPEECFKVF